MRRSVCVTAALTTDEAPGLPVLRFRIGVHTTDHELTARLTDSCCTLTLDLRQPIPTVHSGRAIWPFSGKHCGGCTVPGSLCYLIGGFLLHASLLFWKRLHGLLHALHSLSQFERHRCQGSLRASGCRSPSLRQLSESGRLFSSFTD
ncbi:uncharacterized protein K460DRAFT_170447 [Cucurbitaria berberidis CBS 394.84]|uniref:Uncharacterized protein n=1 Tax=Cucurbitaria berberidis CBS 394.84 TaxID=1168544 RepID=A0A9P4G9R5_9PLEO|nr:uncharacterized protein K460DRAFT_170447 [Cucurbitaria berberidis CBS 394.84]KAF1841621.1 hypothetical protein K460DRAFT_170447 [Cucurbitaria berberidis CBS 394.84]